MSEIALGIDRRHLSVAVRLDLKKHSVVLKVCHYTVLIIGSPLCAVLYGTLKMIVVDNSYIVVDHLNCKVYRALVPEKIARRLYIPPIGIFAVVGFILTERPAGDPFMLDVIRPQIRIV